MFMFQRRRVALCALIAASLLASPGLATATATRPASTATSVDDTVHLNQVQVIGTHNSYHQIPPAKEVALRRQFIGAADDQIEYRHAPLPVQFQSQKVRQIELDEFLDSKGGLYANPQLRTFAGDGPWDPIMKQPGIKVLHIQDVDYVPSCLTLKLCLGQIKTWSDAHPTHMPIAILLELKDDPLNFGNFHFTVPEKWTPAAMDTLDAEIRSVMPPSMIITPDDVRGAHATLQDAVLANGWPTLAQSRGKVMFIMDNASRRTTYLTGHPGLAGRVIFTNANPGDPDAAFVERNDPTDKTIPALVKAGYVVRTRADGDTAEARKNDTSHRDAALASGAQWVSTDYPVPDYGVGFQTSYVAQIPGGTVARCNPVNAPPGCVSGSIDSIYTPVSTPPTSSPPVTPTPLSSTPPATEAPAASAATGASPVEGKSTFTG